MSCTLDEEGYGIACQHLVAKKNNFKRHFRLILTRRGRSYSGKYSRKDERISKCADNAALFQLFGSWMKGSQYGGNIIRNVMDLRNLKTTVC